VDGTPIVRREVEMSPNAQMLLFEFRQAHGRDPSTPQDHEAMERSRQEHERSSLAQRIRALVRERQIARFGITVDDEEARHRWAQDLAKWGLNQGDYETQTRRGIESVVAALKDVVFAKQDPDKVYQDRLASLMSRRDWALRIQYEATPERIAVMESILALPEGDLLHPLPGYRMTISSEKLNKAIDAELVRTDPEFAEYMTLAKTDPGNEKVASKSPIYVEGKRDQWWRQRYREAKIEIKDKRFEGVAAMVQE